MRFNRLRRSKTNHTDTQAARHRNTRRLRTLEMLEGRVMLAADTVAAIAPWQNKNNPLDVNHDNKVSPQDALMIINDLSRHGSHIMTAPVAPAVVNAAATTTNNTVYLDVNGDNQVTPIDALRVINLLAVPQLAQVSLVATDMSGTPLSGPILVGTDFKIQAIVQDIRSPVNATAGVFAAYMNVGYDSSLATIATNATVNFDPFFGLSRTSDVTTLGQVKATGAAATSLAAPGNAPQPIWNVVVHASAGGIETFTPSFDNTGGHDFLLYGLDNGLTADQISFIGTSVTITALPTLSIDSVSKLEGNAGTTPYVFTVTLSSASASQVTVNYNTADVTATTANSDYVAQTNTLTFAPGVTQQLITINVNGDTVTESDEVFNVVLSNPSSNATLGTSNGVGTILNDDVTPSISIGDVTVNNVTSGTTNAVFTVTLSVAGSSTVNVSYATANITALAGADYVGTSGILTFNAGVTSQTITVQIIGDPNFDDVDTFAVNLTNPVNSTLLDAQAIGTINPAVTTPSLAVSNVSQAEGNLDTTDFVFTATLSNAAATSVLVTYTTVDGTATTANNDYIGATGTLTFLPGVTAQTFTVSVIGDTAVESNESFTVNLTPGAGIVPGVQTGTGTIVNDDGVPTITVGDLNIPNAPPGPVNAVFTVSISTAINQAVSVGFATQDNTALAGIDYVGQSGILTFQPGGPTSLTVTVPIIVDAAPENDESFFLNLSSLSPPGSAVIGDAQAVGTIIEQGMTITSPQAVEGNPGDAVPGRAVFTVNLSKAQTSVVTATWATADGTATVANNDYTAASGTVTFAPGVTSQLITVNLTGDTTVEPNETFFVNLSNVTGIAPFITQGTATIINDDGQKALISLQLFDNGGNPLPANSALNVNDTFVLDVFVQDIQTTPTGIASAYLNALYNSTLVTINGPITYGAAFPNIHSGDTSVPGVISDAGAFGNITPPVPPNGQQLLWSIPFKVIDVGLATFTPQASTNPSHPVLVYTNDNPIPANQINFVGTSINIGSNVFAVNNVQLTEGNSGQKDMVFTVTRFLPTSSGASVVYNTSNGTATAGSDYVAQSGTLTFAPGELTKTVTIAINGDTVNEPDETLFLNLSNAIGATSTNSPGVGTILNDDGPVGISVGDATANEGSNLNFVVTLGAVSGNTVTVAYTTADSVSGNLATSGLDYTPKSGTLTFAPGVTQLTIAVQSLGDVLVEPTETFQLVLSNPTNGVLSDGVAQGNIVDVPPAILSGVVYLDLNGSGTKDGTEAGIANATITATRAGSSEVLTTYSNADGTYSFVGLIPGTYTIKETQPGFYQDGRDTHLGVDSPINDTFANVVLGPSASASGYNFGESALRPEFALQFINRRAFFASAVVGSTGGIATSATGLNPSNGDLWVSFDGGWQGLRTIQALFDASKGTASLKLYDNAMKEVAISSPTATGAQIIYNGVAGSPYFLRVSGSNKNVSLNVLDSVSVNNVSKTVSGATTFVFTVSLSAPLKQTGTVAYTTVDNTATTASGDYVATSGVLTFAPGVLSQQVTVQINGNTNPAASESFFLKLSSPTNMQLGSSQGVGTLVNPSALPGSFITLANNSSVAPAVTPAASTPAAAPAATAPAATSASTTTMVAADPATTTDAALEEDEDWVIDATLSA